MRGLSGLVLAACVVAGALGPLAGPAAAGRAIRMESTGVKRLVAREVTFREPSGAVINCEVSMTGEHGVLRGGVFAPRATVELLKTAFGRLPEAVFARVGGGEVAACREILAVAGTLLVNSRGEEFFMRYDGFEGALPNITAIRLTVLWFSIKFSWAERICLFRANAPARKSERGNGRMLDQLSFAAAPLALAIGSPECPTEARMTGTFLIEPRLTISLVP